MKVGQRVICTYPDSLWGGLAGVVVKMDQDCLVKFPLEDNPILRSKQVCNPLMGWFSHMYLESQFSNLQQAALAYCRRERANA